MHGDACRRRHIGNQCFRRTDRGRRVCGNRSAKQWVCGMVPSRECVSGDEPYLA